MSIRDLICQNIAVVIKCQSLVRFDFPAGKGIGLQHPVPVRHAGQQAAAGSRPVVKRGVKADDGAGAGKISPDRIRTPNFFTHSSKVFSVREESDKA